MAKRIEIESKKCLLCGKLFNRGTLKNGRLENLKDYKVRKYCSRGCYFQANSGENHWYWKGGLKKRPDGYVRRSSDDKYIHRIVMEKSLGRKLGHEEIVHHINGDTSDNRIENLELTTNSKHRSYHAKLQAKGYVNNKFRFIKE